MKQVIIMRLDLKMSCGKLAAQACHASVGSYKKTSLIVNKAWEFLGCKKIVVGVESLKELKELEAKARKAKIPHYLVKDAGLTELPAGTTTALGLGPAKENIIDPITGNLKLLK